MLTLSEFPTEGAKSQIPGCFADSAQISTYKSPMRVTIQSDSHIKCHVAQMKTTHLALQFILYNRYMLSVLIHCVITFLMGNALKEKRAMFFPIFKTHIKSHTAQRHIQSAARLSCQ